MAQQTTQRESTSRSSIPFNTEREKMFYLINMGNDNNYYNGNATITRPTVGEYFEVPSGLLQ